MHPGLKHQAVDLLSVILTSLCFIFFTFSDKIKYNLTTYLLKEKNPNPVKVQSIIRHQTAQQTLLTLMIVKEDEMKEMIDIVTKKFGDKKKTNVIMKEIMKTD